MQSRGFPVLLFALTLLLACFFTLLPACQAPKEELPPKYLIGIINPNKASQDINRGFIEGLKEFGYIEGQNTTYILAESSFELEQVIQDMVARNVNLIFTVTTPVTRKAIEATKSKNIPVLFAMQDPVQSGIVKNLSHPEGNATGIKIRGGVPKALEWLLFVKPSIKNVYVPLKHDTKAATQSLEDLRAAADPLGIKLSLAEVNDQLELDSALAEIPAEADAIFILHSIFIHSNLEKIVQAAIARKLLLGSAAAQHQQGVTVAYGMIAEECGKQASFLAYQILSGRSIGDVPGEIVENYLGINLKTAEMTGVHIPNDVLQQADFIVR